MSEVVRPDEEFVSPSGKRAIKIDAMDFDNPGRQGLEAVSGNIDKGSAQKEKVSKLTDELESSKKIFGTYISSVLEKKGSIGQLSPAEASVVRADLVKELKLKKVGAEIIKEIKAEPYYDTGEKIVIPMETGNAEYKIAIFFNEQTRQYKFQLEPVNELAVKLDTN